MVTGNDTNFDIDIPNKYNLAETIQIEPDTFSSPYLSVKTVKFSNNATDYIALIDGDSINIYLYNF